MQCNTCIDRIRPGRRIVGQTAVLLPFTSAGAIHWDEFAGHLLRTAASGLTPALNMDTGFGPQLTAAQRAEVISFARRQLGADARIIAGASGFGDDQPLDNYRRSLRDILAQGAIPIVFQSQWLTAKSGQDLADAYAAVLDGCSEAYAFELGNMFASFGAIYSLDDYARLLELPNLCGAKHSSLDRRQEIDRLELRDRRRPGWQVLTGNDLAIDLVMYGSDYLLGLSTFDPEAFALRDRWWAQNDARFFQLNDALQALGAVAFRDPVPAYKHSAAIYLQLSGKMREIDVHASCPRRPIWEAELLRPLHQVIEAAKRQAGDDPAKAIGRG
jgi:dihydrodipicolinate synthase/N-acetylneuraminate lyase